MEIKEAVMEIGKCGFGEGEEVVVTRALNDSEN